MKKILMTTAAIITMVFVSTASAGDFDNNKLTVELYQNNTVIAVETDGEDLSSVGVEISVLPHDLFGATADLTLGAKYGVVSEDVTLSTIYGVSKQHDTFTAYGEVDASYTVASGSTNGVWVVKPMVGASHSINDKLAAFGEVSYGWDASNDWTKQGGVVEVGMTYNIDDGFYVRPSIFRSFDSASDQTNAALKIGLAF